MGVTSSETFENLSFVTVYRKQNLEAKFSVLVGLSMLLR
jgi:hypothetical protein